MREVTGKAGIASASCRVDGSLAKAGEGAQIHPRVCEYGGVPYFVMTDMDGRDFIEAGGVRHYLGSDGRAARKPRGQSSVKTAIEGFGDMRKVQDYFVSRGEWNFYLMFTLNVNTGRRIGDIRRAKWRDFFATDGKIRHSWQLVEEKTGKRKEVYLNAAVDEAFRVFLEHEPDADVSRDYNEPVFVQLHGTHRGKVVSQEGYRQALIRAGSCLGYEIRSHSMRRGMGKMMLELHPNDPKAKSILMELYNHSSEKMTNKYIGETARLEEEYLRDLGDTYVSKVMNGDGVERGDTRERRPVSVYDNAELRQYMLCAFGKILDMRDETDTVKLMGLYNELLDGLDAIAK